MQLSIVVNVTQVGIAMDLHGHREEPVMLALISFDQLTQFRDTLGPNMRHAVLGQVALMLAERMYTLPVSIARS